MGLVVDGIHALGRAAQKNKFAGPVIGVKESTKVERQFDELTLKAGEGIIGAQAGFTGGATQAGMNIGKGRGVND